MALITKIQEHSGIAVAFVAVSLILFIVGGDILGAKGLLSGNNQEVGKIAGTAVMYPDFLKKVDEAKLNYESSSGPADERAMVQIRERAWNQFIIDLAYQKQFEALGIKVSSEELVDMVQGNNIHPSVRQAFSNPKTGQFDKNEIVKYLKNLPSAPEQTRKAWMAFEKGLAADRLREKYEGLMIFSNYTTTEEAKKEYEAQTAKANLKYLYIPFFSVADSTIKVTDDQLKNYLSKHKDEFKGENTRTIKYTMFPAIASKQDSATMYQRIKDLAKGLATASNDSAYARINTDVPQASNYLKLSDMGDQLRASVGTFIMGGTYGPFQEGNKYTIYKFGGTKKDSLFSVRASHILISPSNKSDSAKATARAKANSILARIKAGANFEALAATEGMDGTSQRGGDLGFFKNDGSMVKKFQEAIFGFNGKGLLPNVVETDFGFHIVKVTEAKTNTSYKVIAISKVLEPSDATRDEAFKKADAFALENKTSEAFDSSVKTQKLASLVGNKITEDASNVNGLSSARELVRWAFNDDSNIGSVSQPFDTGAEYVVATVTGKSEKDNITIEDFREELTTKVRSEIKGEQLLKKLDGATGTLEAIAQKYGAGALVEAANAVALNGGSLVSAGADAIAIGMGVGLKNGKRSKAFVGDNGVFIMENTGSIAAPAIADYSMYKNNMRQTAMQNASRNINEAIKDNAKIVDNRAKFF